MSNEDTEEYEPLPITDGDRVTVKLTHTFVINGQTQWAAAEFNIAVLPEETSDEASGRAQALALTTVFESADHMTAIIDERRQFARQLKETE